MNDTVETPTVETRFPASEASVDERFALLDDERRRALIAALASPDGPADVDELSGAVAALETDDGTDARGSALRRSRLMLHHVPLPEMADCGVISYDPNRRVVMLAAALVETDPTPVWFRRNDSELDGTRESRHASVGTSP